MRATLFARLLLLAAAACVFCGCQTAEPKTNRYVVKPAKAEFYKYGPAQAFGADFALDRGTFVTMVRYDFGFSQILLADGTPGYVATEDLKPAPPPPSTPRPRASSRRVATKKPSNFKPVPGDPLFDLNDVPLPLPTEPESKRP